MPFSIVTGDITRVGAGADAVVNAANSSLAAGGGVCGAIFAAAGHADLQAACDRIGHCDTGSAAVTPGFALSRFVIHAVGPVWHGGRDGEDSLLRSCWRSALEKARDAGAQTVFAPLISAGIYGYPPEEALAVAVSEIGAFLAHNDLSVTLVIYDRASFRLPPALRGALAAHLGNCEAPAFSESAVSCMAAPPSAAASKAAKQSSPRRAVSNLFRKRRESADLAVPMQAPAREEAICEDAVSGAGTLEAILQSPGESFSHMLLRLIDESGRTDADVYRRANLDRRLFSKIRSNADYQPSKATVLALAVSLRLDLDRTLDLLRAAGFALSPASRRDRIVEFFVRSGNYDIFELNEALFAYNEPALGA